MNGEHKLNRDSALAGRSPFRRCAGNVVAALTSLMRPARLNPQHAWMPSPQRLAIASAIAVMVFLICLVFIDAAAARAVLKLPRWIPWFFDQITDYGKSGWFLWPLGILFLLLAALPTLSRMAEAVLAAVMVRVGFLFLAIALPGLFTNIVKHIFGRARPGVGGGIDPYLFHPFSWPAAYAGLPSGHATTALSVVVAFGTLWPRGRTVLWIYALLITASRVAVEAHYPSDVLAGALVGAVGAMMVRRYFALRRLGFSVSPEGAVQAFPGPSLRRIKSVARALLAQ
jgi:membrane-associated phospholipid phosphatase